MRQRRHHDCRGSTFRSGLPHRSELPCPLPALRPSSPTPTALIFSAGDPPSNSSSPLPLRSPSANLVPPLCCLCLSQALNQRAPTQEQQVDWLGTFDTNLFPCYRLL